MIPIYQPSLSGNEKKYVNECLDENWISSKGRFIQSFEQSFEKYINVGYASSVSNGTVALHVANLALGIGPGDEVIVPTLTYIASVNSIEYTGAKPVFVDSNLDNWQIDCDDVRRKITSRTKAIMVVHLYGYPCDMKSIMQIAKEYNLFVIEDCAEALGSKIDGKHVGTFGDISTFSFFGNKTITTGEGGMVVTNDETLHNRVLHLKGQGLAKHREYWHDIVGYNYRMTNICAAIGLAQLEQIDYFLERKAKLKNLYLEKLSDVPVTFISESHGFTNSNWMINMLVENPKDRDSLRAHLDLMGIETRPMFFPIHTMPMYSKKYERHSNAENLGWRGINLPSWPMLSLKEVDTIVESIIDFYDGK